MIVSESPFKLSISLNVLEHLGINLYSNVPSVLSEIVANAYDADATEVRIDWDRENDRIVIEDDGVGMAEKEINPRFLAVGYRRRDFQPGQTVRGRLPMGRKGIGKLSLFSIASVVQVETAKAGEKSAFLMRLNDIRQKIQKAGGNGTYSPERISIDEIDFSHGTRITLTELRKRQTIRTTRALKRRIARRFSVIGGIDDFRVFVDGEKVTPSDRDYYDKVQYIWTYGDQQDVLALCEIAQHFDRSTVLEGASIRMTGWLGTVSHVRHLKDDDGDNLNRIAIFVRGKMAQEDILSDFSERGVYASYLIGELRVDALDTYDGPNTPQDEDAATSSRQRIVEDDERYQALKKLIGDELKHIQSEWSRLRGEEGAEKALEIPAVKDWLESLKPPTRTKAKKWLGKLNRIRLDDFNEQKQLIKHAVLAFEFYRINENLEALDAIGDENLQAALDIFLELDGLEANLYGQIVQQRIHVIRTLQEKVDANAREKAIQEYLFDHLWLLDPAWERADSTAVMETRVMNMLAEVDATLTDDERQGRIDIGYRKTAGQHVVIELKRPERTMTVSELIAQVGKYRSGMKRVLEHQGIAHEPIEFVVLLGKDPRDWSDAGGKEAGTGALQNYNARIVFYDQLMANAERAYQDYLAQREVVDKLDEVIKAIEDYAPPIPA